MKHPGFLTKADGATGAAVEQAKHYNLNEQDLRGVNADKH